MARQCCLSIPVAQVHLFGDLHWSGLLRVGPVFLGSTLGPAHCLRKEKHTLHANRDVAIQANEGLLKRLEDGSVQAESSLAGAQTAEDLRELLRGSDAREELFA
ncbi:hypothetical protein LIER_34214 [Lithospermum erythrorhizon]|uniref:Uncharacterized protein n=1 Tax=Lithospermum erythrorhizon TaxID=34254 RepID=A0AAV3S3U7_LITER